MNAELIKSVPKYCPYCGEHGIHLRTDDVEMTIRGVHFNYTEIVADCISCKEEIYISWSDKDVVDMIESRPTVDAVPVCRCKDCKHHEVFKNGVNGWCNEHERQTDVTYFCADGERD